MNTVLLELNSYAQTLRLFINGMQPSAFSELSNFTFQQVLKEPGTVLEAIGREVNDDFDLYVTANKFEYFLIAKAAENDEYCASCQHKRAKVAASTKARAERLAERLSPSRFTVLVKNCRSIPAPEAYGNIHVSFTADRSVQADCAVDVPTPELAVSAAETLLVNPLIGKAVASAGKLAIFARLNPILTASVPQNMEAGQTHNIIVSSFPKDDHMPKCYVKSSNPAVVSAEGMELTAHGTGSAMIQVYVYGENQPFFTSTVDVKKTVLASRLEFVGLDETLREGNVVPLSVNVFPADAEDASKIVFESSDVSVAEVRDGQLVPTGSGQCEITARTERAFVTKKLVVTAALARLKISQPVFDLNVGSEVPVTVEAFPKDAHNAQYKWHSSDKTVAIVVREDGQEYIKAVGIGACELTCRNVDGTASDTCAVNVQSIMYKKEKKNPKTLLILIIVAFVVLIISLFGNRTPAHAKTPSGQANETTNSADNIKTGYVSSGDFPMDMVWELANRFAAEKQAENDAEGIESFSYSVVEVYGIYFGEAREDTFAPATNSLHILIGYDFFVDKEYRDSRFFPLIFENIQFDSEGRINLSYEDGSGNGCFYGTAEEYLAEIESHYIISKIG